MAFLNILRIVFISTLLFASASGVCHSPRVRKEWRSIGSDERAAWIKAVKCLASLRHNPKVVPTVNPALSAIPPMNLSSSYFDDFVYVHMDLNVLIHQTGLFLPWHRLYVQAFEDELRAKCGYTGVQPYWDWTQDAADFEHATIFSDRTDEGLGSWGDPTNDFQITTGGFKDITVAYPVPHHIRRSCTLQPFLTPENSISAPPGAPLVDPQLMINTTFTKTNVDFTTSSFKGDYIGFQAYFENINGSHPGPHLILGGDMVGSCPFGLQPPTCTMGTKWSSNDPMFFLHHAMVDKIWYEWQRQDSNNKNAFAGGSVSVQVDSTAPVTGAPPLLNLNSEIPGDGLWEGVTIQDVMDTTSGRLCYIYA